MLLVKAVRIVLLCFLLDLYDGLLYVSLGERAYVRMGDSSGCLLATGSEG